MPYGWGSHLDFDDQSEPVVRNFVQRFMAWVGDKFEQKDREDLNKMMTDATNRTIADDGPRPRGWPQDNRYTLNKRVF